MGGRTVCDKVCLSVVSTSASSPTTSLGSLVAGAVRGGSACGQMGFGVWGSEEAAPSPCCFLSACGSA